MRLTLSFIAVIACCAQMSSALAQSGLENTPASVSPPVTIVDIDIPSIIADNEAVAIVDNRPLMARILGGGDASPGEYPSMVALVNPGFAPLDRRLFCGATVVAERWVMSAAHCVFDAFGQLLDPQFVRAVAGINDLRLETPDTEHRIMRIIVHPDYDRTLELPPNDIALLELESAIAAPSVTLFTGETEDHTGELGFIAGWGATEYDDPVNAVFPTALQDAAVPLVANDVCNAPQSYDGLIEDEHLCAGFVDGQVDACVGDSGGPLFISVNGEQLQAGITSFGIGCGLPLFYGIYTNVSHFIPFLSQYFEVPFQSPELVAERELPDDIVVVDNDFDIEGTGDSGGTGVIGGGDVNGFSGVSGGGGGAFGLYACLVLLVSIALRNGRRRKVPS